jgi:8-amino-7-oxononanoate synthase
MTEHPGDLNRLSPEEKRRFLEQLLRSRSAAGESRIIDRPGGFVFPPEYLALREKFAEMEKTLSDSVYFQVSEGINRDRTVIEGREYINFAGYNYLGMSGDPTVSHAAKEAIDRYGTSVSASRLASGERPPHRELERALAGLLGTEDCIVFVGGYGTNETVIGHICRAGDIILYDSLIHASIQAGCALSGAKTRPFPHNNFQALDRILAEERSRHRQALIAIEGVYSMDGDIPDLPSFIEIKKRHRALLMIDEAHSIGVLGKHGAGIGEHCAVDRRDVDLWMGTLSKSFASCGGYIAGEEAFIRFLRFTTPGFVYSVGMSPPNTAAALASVEILKREPERVRLLQSRAKLFLELARERGFNTGASMNSAVIPVILGQTIPCMNLYRALKDEGIYVLPIMYPAVPDNASRLRFFVNCTHTEEQIRFTVDAIARHYPQGQ